MALPATAKRPLPALLVALALVAGAPLAQAAGKLYCCNDASGKQVCGDLMPQECYGRAYREVGDSGRTVRNVEAPLTADAAPEVLESVRGDSTWLDIPAMVGLAVEVQATEMQCLHEIDKRHARRSR